MTKTGPNYSDASDSRALLAYRPHYSGTEARISLCKEMDVFCTNVKREVKCKKCLKLLSERKSGE